MQVFTSVTTALFKKKNREMISIGDGRNTFKVEGFDITKEQPWNWKTPGSISRKYYEAY